MQSIHLSVPSSTGTAMAATIDFPSRPPRAFGILAHCFAGSRNAPGASRVSKRLSDHGIATLRFDFPGLGQSEGEFAHTSFSQNVADITASYEFLEQNYAAPQLLVGHSLGGAAILQAATNPALERIRAVATIGAPCDPAHAARLFPEKIAEAEIQGLITFNLGGQEITISRTFLEDLARTNPKNYLPKMSHPLLILHSPEDHIVDIHSAEKLFQLSNYPKSLVALEGCDHLLTKANAAHRVADTIAHWAQTYLEPDYEPSALKAGMVVSHSARGLRYGAVVRSSFDTLNVDKPRSEAGKGQGHTAVDLLMMSIATATSQAIQEVAHCAKLELEDVRVRLAHVYGTTFERRISVSGAISEFERKRLIAVGQKVPSAVGSGNLNIMDVR